MKETLGIIGGMGPLATAELFTRIVRMTDSKTDADHIHILIDNNTSVPDRSEAILHHGISPVNAIVESMKKLSSIGASVFAIPCNTAHFFYEEISEKSSLRVINMIEETAKKTAASQYRRVGILATNGAVYSCVFDKYFSKFNIELMYPNKEDQQEIMNFIYLCVKAGNSCFDTQRLKRIIGEFSVNGAETLILGCTELSIGLAQFGISCSYIDTLDVLAERAVIESGYRVNT